MARKKIPADRTSDTGELRRQAEAKLIENKKKTGPLPELESEARRLVHELQVHQIELEMQNEELMQARAELEAALDQYTSLYDFAPVGYFTLARDGQIQKANLAGAKLLGTDRSKLISRRFRQFVAIDSRLTFSTFLDKVFSMEGSNKEVCEVLLQGENTAARWVHIEAATDVPQNEVCRAVVVDITERKHAERALRISQQQTSSILDSTLDAILTMDEEQNIIIFNRAAEKMFKCPLNEALGHTIDRFLPEFVRKEHREKVRAFGELNITNRSMETPALELTCLRMDGELFPSEVSISKLEVNGRKLYTAIVRDISERKQAEEQKKNYATELERRVEERTIELTFANRAKDEFLANMSHELRTPLNSILGLSESLLEQMRGPLNEKQEQYIGLIQSSGQHLLGLINDILQISKIEAGKLDLHPNVISVKEVCESSLNFVKEMAAKKAISIKFTKDQSISTLRADPQRLKQILVNMLNNAVKFTPVKGKVSLEVSLNTEKDCIRFSVTDNGIGISPEDLPKLFAPFTQLDSNLSREYEGTGLGLMLILKLTELHGGSVHVESEPDKGTQFTIVLPWSKQETSPQKGDSSSTTPIETFDTPTPISVPHAKILLAEDNESNVLTVQEYLSAHGYDVTVAHDGLEAIALTKKASPDIILMDIQMPNMDGLEAIRRLRAAPKSASVPIIAVTALAMPGDRERCLEAGANEYISKPVSLKGLVETIHTFFAKEG